jgi:hypothetical protein
VLPRVALASNSPSIDVPVDVSVKVIVVVDVYVAMLPIAVAPVVVRPYASQNKSGSKSQSHAGVVSRVGVRIIGIGRRRRSVNHLRVVRGNVNYIGVSLLNYDRLLTALNRFGLHFLLRVSL